MKIGYWVIGSALVEAGLDPEHYSQAWAASCAVAHNIKYELEAQDQTDYSVVAANNGEVIR